jgi:predicted NAD/FAD-binding protein
MTLIAPTAFRPRSQTDAPKRIAVIGSGISGMSAAWLLSERHAVTVYEKDGRLGGHSNTVDARFPEGVTPVDTGFIVFNETNYPNLTALFKHLNVTTRPSDMTFAVSLDEGRTEYAAKDLTALLARPSNLFSPRFWSMASDLLRFYRRARIDISASDPDLISLGDYLDAEGYSKAFQNDHLLPQAAAIWSAPPDAIRDYPACAFVRFFENHGLLQFLARPLWRTVEGGSRAYVQKLTAGYADRVRLGRGARKVRRVADGVEVLDASGRVERFDDVVIASHGDQALAMLEAPTADEARLLGAFRYTRNLAVLHTDPALMPRRKGMWSAWNYVGRTAGSDVCSVTYWMNLLQGLSTPRPLFVTLNPHRAPAPETVLKVEEYDHPLFDAAAVRAQRQIWSLQGVGGIWYCGAHFGSGFHEDGLQSGLAVAEQLGGVKRPWRVAGESDRICVGPPPSRAPAPLERVA